MRRPRFFPLCARLERQKKIREFDPHRVGGNFRAAEPRPDVCDLVGKFGEQKFFDPGVVGYRFLHRDSGEADGCADDGALTQLRKKLAAHAGG